MTNQGIILLLAISGFVISLHPLLLSVFIALIAGAFGKQHKKPYVFTISLSYMFALAIVICLFGFGTSLVFNSLSFEQRTYTALVIAVISVLWGIYSIKEYFWYSLHRTPRQHISKLLHNKTMKQNSIANATILGFATAYAALFTIAIPVITLTAICSLLRPLTTGWTIYFVIGLLTPLLCIIIAALSGFRLSALIKWKEDNKAILRLSTGLLAIILGWIIFLLLSGSMGAII